ncbi:MULTISPECIES: hypothetical protein [Pseudomonas]|uniref:hypothetical protein n=1 Tax=Pseudomonas TaxID=286 RepID=UPI0015A9CC08|nr:MULTISPECIES: hypothetical protein [Pseudomonas]MBH3384866.1 hypothetical protein [Pseudomonas juntendi]MBR7520086.1 hypothetical protein [Pseudomonas juntendi]
MPHHPNSGLMPFGATPIKSTPCSPAVTKHTQALVLRKLQAFFAGEPVLTPVRP